jgi:hypothetical protein
MKLKTEFKQNSNEIENEIQMELKTKLLKTKFKRN